jgi:glyoxylase-like metal-dependent hydrolase (beta-lactamase superfamily II)
VTIPNFRDKVKLLSMHSPIEDDARDILAKAARGMDLDPATLAREAGQPEQTVLAALGRNAYPAMKDIPDAAWRALATATRLAPDALLAIARNRYRPQVAAPSWLARIVSRHKSMEVNAWVLADPATRQAVLIDTGNDARLIISHLARHRWQATTLLLTHDHSDHTAGLPDLRAALPGLRVFSPALDHVPGTATVHPGDTIDAAGFQIRALPTPGHTDGGTSYSVAGTRPPVCFVGDALFAGSIGGARFSYSAALSHLREQVFPLPEETLLCPGHGPLTTIALESAHNPFFAITP